MIHVPFAMTALIAAPAVTQVRVVPEQPASAAAARGGVDVFLINDSDHPSDAAAPTRVEVTAADGARLVLEPDAPAPQRVAAHGFARLRYTPAAVATADTATPSRTAAEDRETRSETSRGSSAGFLDRFAPYAPTYSAIGGGDFGTKLQFSFAFQPFGGDSALSHLKLAYTQTMFWATDLPSGPFRATTYSPEAFVDYPLAPDLTLALGFRHDSNGAADPTSIDVNRVYLRVARRFDLGGGWRAELVPQAWFYVGRRGYTRDVKDYLGYTALAASVGRDDGLKLSVTGRGNFATGKGAAEAFVSYPLTAAGGFGVYLFGQGFTGYAEAIDDYRTRDSHARIGIALTR